jgi:hypothetical protein
VTQAPWLRRGLIALSATAFTWAAVIALTGGVAFHLFSLRISSRNPLNAVVIGALIAFGALALAAPRVEATIRADLRWLNRASAGVAAWLGPAGLVAIVGIGMRAYAWAVARPLWLDEQMIALNLRDRSLTELAGPLLFGQSAPFGWLAAERSILLALGTDERALRLLPTLFGIATILAAAIAGRRMLTPLGSAVLVLLLAVGQTIALYAVELKPYSTDVFWGLVLPVMAAWVAASPREQSGTFARRAAVWWLLAAGGQWLGNGALLVTPGCAVAVFAIVWRRRGHRDALGFVVWGAAWLVSFGLHYLVSTRYALDSDFLRTYWAFAMPPVTAGVWETLRWLADRLPILADKPGGTDLWITFWISTGVGLALGRDRGLSLILAAVVASAFAFAALHQVPLYERLSLWVLPSLYLGVALFIDAAVHAAREARRTARWSRGIMAIAIVLVALPLCTNIVARGRYEFITTAIADTNRGLDDRSGVRWLMEFWRPGDAIVTTHLALPAVWWYSADDVTLFEVAYSTTAECRPGALRQALAGRPRVFIYLGFRFDDVPKNFDDVLLGEMATTGRITMAEDFASAGHIVVFDQAPASSGDRPPTGAGCVTVRTARRW